MANITKKEYKSQLKAQIITELQKLYKKDDTTRKGLSYWIEFNKQEKIKLDDKLAKDGTIVEG